MAWRVTRYGKELFRSESDSDWECTGWLLRHQSASVYWACKWEGYKIEKVKDDRDKAKREDNSI